MGDKVLVNEGLGAGDHLIAAGFQKIKPGAQVKAVEQQETLVRTSCTQNGSSQPLVKEAE